MILSTKSSAVALTGFLRRSLCLLCCWGSAALANTNQIELSAWLEPNQEIVVSQQVDLIVEIATPHWFTGGTRIAAFEIDDVVVLRREKFAVNSTRREGQDSWSVQTWAITLYPQRAGTFRVPPIDILVSAANESGVAVQYALQTEALGFSTVIPAEVTRLLNETPNASPSWLASNRFAFTERYDKATTSLQVGDAVKRLIEIKAENVAAMMLPAPEFAKIPGLANYHAPPKIVDSVNRGEYIASRLETLSYVVEQKGSYTLPALSFYWWDIAQQTMRTETLPARVISTEGIIADEFVPAVQEQNETAESAALLNKTVVAWTLLGFLLLAVLVWLLLTARSEQTQHPTKHKVMRRLVKQYQKHCGQQDYPQASRVFYQWLSLQSQAAATDTNNTSDSLREYLRGHNAPELLAVFENLMAAAHGPQQSSPSLSLSDELLELPAELSKLISANPIQKTPSDRVLGVPLKLRLN